MKKFFSEFREFAIKGNALDLAIGVIIGAAFKAIVDSLVNDIIMPLVGILMGGKDFTNLIFKIGDAQIKYGSLIQTAVNFLIVAFCLFLLVKFINRIKSDIARAKEEEIEEAKEEPAPKSDEVVLLEQIRDSLNNLKQQ